jgi:hypothetical protein
LGITGTTNGDYTWWNNVSQKWVVGSNNVTIGANTANNPLASGILPNNNNVVIGAGASVYPSCPYSIAIGTAAQATGTKAIVINANGPGAYGANVQSTSSGLFVKPVTNLAGGYYLIYAGMANDGQISYSISSPSDLRLKKDVANTSLGLEFIKKLRPVEFRWKDRKSQAVLGDQYEKVHGEYAETFKNDTSPGVRLHQGFIAQEVKQILDDMGIDSAIYFRNNDPGDVLHDVQGVKTEELVAPLVKAIQEQDAKIQDLQSQIDTIKKALNM